MHRQPATLGPLPAFAGFCTFDLRSGVEPAQLIGCLSALPVDDEHFIAVGQPTIARMGVRVPELTSFAERRWSGGVIPSTQRALLVRVDGASPKAVDKAAKHWQKLLSSCFDLAERVDALDYDGGRDLTGFKDGTENPHGDKELYWGLARQSMPGLRGSSYLVVQRWVHDLAEFEAWPLKKQERVIGRTKATDKELPHAPPTAHVRRTDQQDYVPPAWMVRRSMAYRRPDEVGLMFVSFGSSLWSFERQLARMTGAVDGITDALFTFSKPVTGSYYWVPPARDGHLDLRYFSGQNR